MSQEISLEFAPGTTQASQDLVQQLSPGDMFDAYRKGRHVYQSTDLVVVVADRDPEAFEVWPRLQYIQRALRRNGGQLSIAHQSAHKIMKLPADSDTFWLVFEVRQLGVPVMCVIHAMRYQKSSEEIVAQA